MSFLKNILFKLSGNRFLQDLLEKNVLISHYLMGVGSGGRVSSSGEFSVIEALKKKRSSPYCIFDVGANKGQFLHLTLEGLGKNEFHIHCFEPGHETYKCLVEDCKYSENVYFNNFGMGKERSKAVLYYDSAGSGLASLTRRKLDHFNIVFSESEEVAIHTIDDYCSENSIDYIDLLKIDIEGHELDALDGAKGMFADKAIGMVTFEFGGCNIDTRTFFQDFWRFFEKANFTLYRITPSGYMHPLQEYREIHEQFRTVNFMAIANEA